MLYFIYYDYSLKQSIEKSSSFRLMFVASVFLGSRLGTSMDMFCLLIMELLTFGCRIFTRSLILKRSKNAYTGIIVVQCLFNSSLMGISKMNAMIFIYLCVEAFIVLVIPCIYRTVYKYKKYNVT